MKLCSNCQFENKKTSRKCQSCHENLTTGHDEEAAADSASSVKTFHDVRIKVSVESNKDNFKLIHEKCVTRPEYERFDRSDVTIFPEVKVLKPIAVNPNSYENIRLCLLNIGKQSGIQKYGTGKRYFVFIYCDGVPYNMINRVISCTFRCTHCKQLLLSGKESSAHSHVGQEYTYSLEFDWVLVLPGGGHIEMNMLQSVVELLWPVCWKEMVMMFNFRSEMALRSAKQVSDHHKGWTIFRLFRHALVDELLVPYVRMELEKSETNDADNVELSPSKYFAFLACAVDPNYTFLADVAFELCDAMAMFRAGIRTGRSDMVRAGRLLFSKMWCGRRHPQYRELDVQDLIQHNQMPEKVRLLADTSMSLNTTGVACTGEAPDFRLEEVNKQTQHFMPQAPKESD